MADVRNFESVLLERLTRGGIDKSLLKEVSSSIVKLKKSGLVIDKVLVKGQPRAERVIINGTIDPEFWVKFRDLGNEFRRFEVFPYGIINPEGFRFKGTIRM